MSKTTHTPGPWKVLSHGGVGPKENATICRPDGRTMGEAVANAQLIAAAPELLEALQKFERSLVAERDCHYEGCSDGEGNVPSAEDQETLEQIDTEIESLRSLIAKAKGDA